MARYVLEMDSPSGCLHCPMCDYDMYYCHAEVVPVDEQHECNMNSDGSYCKGVPDWCPLKSIDDPDILHPLEGFTRNSIYSESMRERDTIIQGLYAVVVSMLENGRDKLEDMGFEWEG